MKTSRSVRLQPIQQIAERREDEALACLAECQRNERDHEQRLNDLRRYIEEYSAPARGTSTPALLNNRLNFLARLREAERVQMELLEQACEHTQAERARWMLKQRDTKVLEQLAAAYRIEESRQSERREQKNLDEFAGQQRLRVRNAAADTSPASGASAEELLSNIESN